MHLFTSNSRFLLGIAFSWFGLFVLYNVLVTVFPLEQLPRFPNAKDSWKANFERYSGAEHTRILFTGSSLTNAVPKSYLPSESFALGLSGGDTATAVALAGLRSSPPNIVIVEVNILDREIDKKFVESMNDRNRHLTVRFPAFRTYNQPIVYFKEIFTEEARNIARDHISFACGTPHDRPEWAKARSKTVEGLTRVWEKSTMVHNAKVLKQHVDALIERGVDVYLVRFPVHPDIHKVSYYKQVVDVSENIFPSSKYNWIIVNNNELAWYDGIHLEPSSAYRVISRIGNEIVKNSGTPPWDFSISCGSH